MNKQKNITVPAGFVISVSLLAVSLTALLLTIYNNHVHFRQLSGLCQEIIAQDPDAKPRVLSSLKAYTNKSAFSESDPVLLTYGYTPSDFLSSNAKPCMIFGAVGFLTSQALFLITLLLWHKRETSRIKMLTDYLEKVNTGRNGVLFTVGEDDFSKLQDEIYKTVTELYQTRDAALKARNSFAENLYNIAHQIKTPITSISLSVQMIQKNPASRHLEQIKRQLIRLTYLEESLLLLSRIDSGTLTLERKRIGVYTLLMLAADNLEELLSKADVTVEIPYLTPPLSDDPTEQIADIEICADLDWTMEAMVNLLKNCMEHTPAGGTIHCTYERNPLYTLIRIWDTGSGFAKEDIPRLFERFYRGRHARDGGIGIGLSLARAIIESQNGTVTAYNLTDAGACFEVRFYP